MFWRDLEPFLTSEIGTGQRLKPQCLRAIYGTAEAVPYKPEAVRYKRAAVPCKTVSAPYKPETAC